MSTRICQMVTTPLGGGYLVAGHGDELEVCTTTWGHERFKPEQVTFLGRTMEVKGVEWEEELKQRRAA